MTKVHQLFSDRTRIARVVCMLLFVVFVLSLAGCDGVSDGSDSSSNERMMNACWLCPMFERVYDSVVAVAESLISATARSAISLLGVGYALWLAIFILKYMSSVKEPDVAAFWRTMAQQSMWVVLGAGLLLGLMYGDSASAMKYFAEPVFGGFVEAGIRMLQSLGSEVSCTGDTRSALLCLVGEMHDKLSGTVLMAVKAMTIGSLISRLTGLVVVIVAIILMVRLPLLLVDTVFCYGIALCLLPLAVAAYPFKPTRDFTGKIAKQIVELGFGAMGLAAFSACCVKILRDCITQNAPFLAASNVAAYSGNPDQLEKDLAGPGMMSVLFISFFLTIFSEVIFDFMQALSGGSGGGNGSMGKAVTNSVKKTAGAAKKAANFAMNASGRMKDKKAYKTANSKEPEKPGDKPADYDSNPQAKKRYDQQQKQYEKEMKKREMASERLQDRGYYARGADGKMHATKALDDLTRNDRVSGPFKGLKKAINNLHDLHDDLHDNHEQRGDKRLNHSQNGVSDYDETYGFKGKVRGTAEWEQTKENNQQLRRQGGLQGAGDYRHHSAYNKEKMEEFNRRNGINPDENTPEGINVKENQGLLKDKDGYDGFAGANELNTPDYSK